MPSAFALSPVMQRLPLIGRIAGQSPRHIGIDIGIDRVKTSTLGIQPTLEGRHVGGWLSRSEFKIPVDPAGPPQPDWVDVMIASLRERLPRCVDGQTAGAMISLPIPWIHYQTSTGGELDATQEQCSAMFQGSIFGCRAHLSHWPAADDGEQRVVAAIAEDAACRVASAVAEVGYQVQGILPHGVALLGAATQLTSLTASAVLLLELSGGVVALRNGSSCGLCRILPGYGGSADDLDDWDQLEPWLQETAVQVNASIRYAARLGCEVDEHHPILICGAAANLPGVDAALASMLSRSVACWRYAGRIRPQTGMAIHNPESADAGMAVSLSLAGCGLQAALRRRPS